VCAPSHRVAGFTQQVACDETRPGATRRDGRVALLGPAASVVFYSMATSSAEDVPRALQVPLLAQPSQRGRVARDVPGGRGGEPAAAGIARADDRADAADQRALPLCGSGRTGCLNLWTLHRCQSQQYALARL